MNAIWYNNDLDLDDLQSLSADTMAHYLHMKWVEVGNDFLRMSMPVTQHVKQPYGIVHGGASCAMAETIGSMGSYLVVNPDKFRCVGLEINANHIRSVREGTLFALAKPVHLGRSTHIWDIRISDEKNQLTCISRLTVAILEK